MKFKNWMTKFKKIRDDDVKDLIGKIVSCFFSWFIVVIFIAILIFIIISAVPGFEQFGISGILGTTEYNLGSNKASIWPALAVTLLINFGAVILAIPIGIKTAIFIKFRLNKNYQKTATILVQSLSGIPSVVFGLFALKSLGPVISTIFSISSIYTVLNAIVMLTFMILPTIISLTLNTYNNISYELITNTIGLGTTRTKAIYSVYKKKARNGTIIAVIIAIGRAVGETMALSMILTSENYGILNQGLGSTLTSSLGTLGSLIATNMFSETGGEAVRGVLYAFGIFLFVIIILLNSLILILTKEKRKSNLFNKVSAIFNNIISFIPDHLFMVFSQKKYKDHNINNLNNNVSTNEFISYRFKNNKWIHAKSIYHIFLEYLCTFIVFGFLLWILFDIVINGFRTISTTQTTIFDYTINTTGQAFVNTLIIIFIALIISVPICLLVAIYLNEYLKESKSKRTILFFIDCLGSCPSIIFGMFGLTLFIEILGISSAGSIGKSLLAGALTISIVIFPTLIRTMQQNLESVSKEIRNNAYALGCGKWQTIWKVVIPQCTKAMVSCVVLAIGRIIAETAPLYLTAGLSSASSVGLLFPGQTLTTRIYAQLSSNNLNSFDTISYECALIALLLIIGLIWIGNYLIPNYGKIKNHIINTWLTIKLSFVAKEEYHLEQYKSQVVDKTLYLSKQQAEHLNMNRFINRYYFDDKKLYKIKYLPQAKLLMLKEPRFIKAIID